MILDTIARLPLYESQIPGAGQIAAAFLAKTPQAAPCEVREKAMHSRKMKSAALKSISVRLIL